MRALPAIFRPLYFLEASPVTGDVRDLTDVTNVRKKQQAS